MGEHQAREDLTQQYLEEFIPKGRQSDVEHLAGEVARGALSRRGFLSRTSSIGIGATAGTTILTALLGRVPKAAAMTGTPDTSRIIDKYKNLTVGVPVYAFGDENEILLAAQLEAAAKAANLNWKFKIQDTQADTGKAAQVMDSFITQGANLIIDIVVPPRLVAAQMARAKEKNIPVFGIYTFGLADPDVVVDFGGLTAVEATYLINFMIFDQRIRHPGRKKIKLGVIDSQLDVIRPRRGALDGMLGLPINQDFEIVQIVPDVDPANTVQVATQATQAILTKNPDVDCIWTNWPPSGVPVGTAVDSAGKAGTCKVYGNVAQSSGIELVRGGKSALVATSWVDLVYVSWGCIDLALSYLAGRKPSRLALLTTHPVPMTAIDQVEANSPNVQQVDVLGGKQITTWMGDAGAYRERFVSKWNDMLSS